MPTYATRADCLAYTENLTITDNAAFDRLIERAERQVEGLLAIRHSAWDAAGPTIVPADLNAGQAEALKRAVCAQVEYRLENGESFQVRDQHTETSGPEFSTKGRLSRIGPKVVEELRRAPGLTAVGRGARARP